MEGYSLGTKSRLDTEKHREKVQDTGKEENPQKADFKQGLRPTPTWVFLYSIVGVPEEGVREVVGQKMSLQKKHEWTVQTWRQPMNSQI